MPEDNIKSEIIDLAIARMGL